MANTMTGGEEYASGTRSKKLKPGVAKRVADRKAFVAKQTSMPKRPGADGADSSMASNSSAKKMARQKFYVQTRISEMQAKGKTVTPEMRKQLRQKFQSGDVARKGFAAPKKKTSGTSSSSSSTSSSSSSVVAPKVTTKVAPRMDSRGNTGFGKGKPSYAPTESTNKYSPSQIVRRGDSMTPKSTNP
jgi:hypothetical protein